MGHGRLARPRRHGKAGYGISVEFGVKTGPVTIFGVTQTREGNLKMLAAEGESMPGPTMRIGNTNSRLRFTLPPAAFMNAWVNKGKQQDQSLGSKGPSPLCSRHFAPPLWERTDPLQDSW